MLVRWVKVIGFACGVGLLALSITGCSEPTMEERIAGFQTPDILVFRPLSEPIQPANVQLVSVGGELESADLFEGKWTLLYFGYTYCPDVCPTEMSVLSQVARTLRENEVAFPWQIVFVSVDPDRDTPEHLDTYVRYFDEAVQGVTGAPEQVRALATSVRADYRIDEASRGEVGGLKFYLIDHDTAFRLIAPDGRMVGVFPSPHRASVMTPVLESFIEEVGQ